MTLEKITKNKNQVCQILKFVEIILSLFSNKKNKCNYNQIEYNSSFNLSFQMLQTYQVRNIMILIVIKQATTNDSNIKESQNSFYSKVGKSCQSTQETLQKEYIVNYSLMKILNQQSQDRLLEKQLNIIKDKLKNEYRIRTFQYDTLVIEIKIYFRLQRKRKILQDILYSLLNDFELKQKYSIDIQIQNHSVKDYYKQNQQLSNKKLHNNYGLKQIKFKINMIKQLTQEKNSFSQSYFKQPKNIFYQLKLDS
ncbi:unnamed protein product [Paramecium pentaurelia]|uniref:Uncharacterized protein n=1 Tax=Paramecium pentaurelia TaxID=43138 RepID=A0A8S1Y5F3_9CILI|nr:unnamed protein product [Paramecium pentaurelia]